MLLQADVQADLSAVREEAAGLRVALDAQRGELERHYATQNARMRKEYEQARKVTPNVFVGGDMLGSVLLYCLCYCAAWLLM
jgi:hypothetical protein